MRLRRLDLLRYGRFADRSLDFGAAGTEHDVTLVFGPNEAGKSTAFAAWLDVLFGMPGRNHPYAFRYARNELLVGATIETVEGPMTLRRTGKKHGSLTDEGGRVVDERRLADLLHGLEKEDYKTRFSLNDDVLRRGGADIAKAQGDLGQLLHAGSSGLAGFAEVLERTQAQIDAFHKPQRRNTTLLEARAELAEIDAAIAESRLDPREFDELQRRIDAALVAQGDAGDALADARRAVAIREAAERRQQIARRIARIDADLDQAPAGPDLPPDAGEIVGAALQARQTAGAALAQAEAAQATAERALREVEPDEVGQAVAADLDRLEAALFDDNVSLVSRASTADADLLARRRDRDGLQARLAEIVRDIAGDGPTPREIVLPVEVVQGLRDAALQVRATAAARREAEARLVEARAGMEDVAPVPESAKALADVLETLPPPPDAALGGAETVRAAADRAAGGLPRDWRALADAGLPESPEIRMADRACSTARETVAAAENRLAETREQLQERLSQREIELRSEPVVSDAEIARSRRARDDLWAAHRAALDNASADDFEAAMRQDDARRDAHHHNVAGRTRLARVDAEIDALRGEVDRRSNSLEIARQALSAPQARLQVLAQRLGLSGEPDPETMAARLDGLRAALDATLDAERLERGADRARAAWTEALSRLSAACDAAGGAVPPGRDPLRAARELHAELQDRRAKIDAQRQRADFVDRLEADLTTRIAQWSEADAVFEARAKGTWCAQMAPERLLQIVDRLIEVARLSDEALRARRRVDRLEAARAAFDDQAAGLRDKLQLAADARVDDVLAAARNRAEAALSRHRALAEARKERDAAMAEITAQRQVLAEADTALADLFSGQELEAGPDPRAALRALAARDALRGERKSLLGDLETGAPGLDPAAVAMEAANDDPARMAERKDALDQAEAAWEARAGEVGQARGALAAALARGGGAEQMQRREALLESLRDAARGAALAIVGAQAAAGALASLREDRRGPMLGAAERAFSTMTGGQWSRLHTEPGGSGERLMGIRDGESWPVEAMSTGTLGQLYLALRVAGHADFTRRFGPLPFMTDDILETFDDARARAALTLTAEMGRLGQAILFTHHRHLIDLAREAIPGLTVLEL